MPVHVQPRHSPLEERIKERLAPQWEHVEYLKTASLKDFLTRASGMLGGRRLVVLLDQFEEMFTLQDEAARDAFARQLLSCLDDNLLPVRWLLALRGEWLSQLAKLDLQTHNPFANQYLLNAFDRAQAREIVVEPARRLGVRYATGLVEALIDDLAQEGRIAPPQLQLVCSFLFDSLDGEPEISLAAYEGAGRASGILRGYLKRVLEGPDLAAWHSAAERALEALVTAEGRRDARTRDDLVAVLAADGIDEGTVDRVLDLLHRKRLLRNPENRPGVYELVHDYLLESIRIDPGMRARKAARDMLDRERLNQEQFAREQHDRYLIGAHAMRVISAQREALRTDAGTDELLVASAFETGVELEEWLEHVRPELSRQTLEAGMEHPEPALRSRAARHVGPYANDDTWDRLSQVAACDEQEAVRDAALEVLAGHDSARARQVLLSELAHVQPARRARAARSLSSYLDAEVVEALLRRAREDEEAGVWQAALETLAHDEAAPHRRGWRPLLRASMARQAALFAHLKRQRADMPLALRLRVAPARAVDYVRREAQTRPAWLAVRVLLLVALYLGGAWLAGWPPFVRWDRVPGSPRQDVSAMQVAGDHVYVGSFSYGLAHRDPNGQWSDWQDEGLPGEQPDPFDLHGDTATVYDLAVDPALPQRVYAILRYKGLYRSEDAGRTWAEVGAGQVPTGALSVDLHGTRVSCWLPTARACTPPRMAARPGARWARTKSCPTASLRPRALTRRARPMPAAKRAFIAARATFPGAGKRRPTFPRWSISSSALKHTPTWPWAKGSPRTSPAIRRSMDWAMRSISRTTSLPTNRFSPCALIPTGRTCSTWARSGARTSWTARRSFVTWGACRAEKGRAAWPCSPALAAST